MNIIQIEPFQIFMATGFILIAALISLLLSLGLVRSLVVGAIRTILQLFLLGYFLSWIFSRDNPVIIVGLLVLMIFFAARTAISRTGNKSRGQFWPVIFSLLITGLSITFFVCEVIIEITPWYDPRYLIPLGGMVIGNSMNGVSVSLSFLFNDFSKRKMEVITLLSLGATPWEASLSSIRSALSTGLIPIINSMNAAGLVFIPGMMTGQILAGADPVMATSYQIVVMLMLTAATAIGSIIAVGLAYRLAFNSKAQFIL